MNTSQSELVIATRLTHVIITSRFKQIIYRFVILKHTINRFRNVTAKVCYRLVKEYLVPYHFRLSHKISSHPYGETSQSPPENEAKYGRKIRITPQVEPDT